MVIVLPPATENLFCRVFRKALALRINLVPGYNFIGKNRLWRIICAKQSFMHIKVSLNMANRPNESLPTSRVKSSYLVSVLSDSISTVKLWSKFTRLSNLRLPVLKFIMGYFSFHAPWIDLIFSMISSDAKRFVAGS